MSLFSDLKNKLARNWSVLKDQAEDAREAIALDIETGNRKWRDRDRWGALHNWTFGVISEVFEHMGRWLFYGFLIWVTFFLIGFMAADVGAFSDLSVQGVRCQENSGGEQTLYRF
jgi:hypothetical protein